MLESSNEILRKADDHNVALRLLPSPLLDPQVHNIVKIDVRQKRRNAAALHATNLTHHPFAVFQHTALFHGFSATTDWSAFPPSFIFGLRPYHFPWGLLSHATVVCDRPGVVCF